LKRVNPLLIFILALGVFGIITTEMGIVGVLPEVSRKYNISTSQTGSLVSIFALVVAVSGPFVTLLASKINRKVILLISVLMFAISNVVYAYTTIFNVMLIFRIIPAIFHPVFFSVAIVTASQLVPPEKSNKAVMQVFAGITIGFAFGVPLTSYLAEHISLKAGFLFSGVVSLIAFTGILIGLPNIPVKGKMSYGQQLRILKKPQLWINIAAIMFTFAAMFSVYSYFAEYVGRVSLMSSSWVSVLLMAFGLVMIAGNYLFGFFLQKNIVKTVILFPLAYIFSYLLVYFFGTYFIPMIIIVLIWGIVHSGGLIVSQTWLTVEAKEAPEFGNSLFISFSNLGITLGATIGGWFISQWGIHQLIWSGIVFALLSFLLVIIKIKIFGARTT